MPLSNEKLLQQAKSRHQIARQFSEKWRKEARQAYDFVAGHQISPDDMRELERKKRPAVVFNLIGPNLKAISGMERGNRHELRYLPRETSQIDGALADIYNQTVKWVNDRNDNEFYESKAFRDMTICGMGWTQLRVDYDEDPQGKINCPAIDPLRKLWDPSAKMENLVDRRYDFTEAELDLEEFKALGPEFRAFCEEHRPSSTVFGQSVEDEFETTTLREHRPDNYAAPDGSDDSPGRELGRVAVLEYNFWIVEEIYALAGADGQVIEEFTSRKRAETMAAAVETHQVLELGERRQFYKAWFNGEELIHQQKAADPTDFCEHCITGEYDRNTGHWFGVVRAMIDPATWSNKLFMQLLHIVNSNAKGGFFFRQNVFANKKKALSDWAKGDQGIEVQGNEPIGHLIMERGAIPLPSALHELLLFVTGIIPRVSGFNMELLGMAGKDQPGVLEHMRKQAGMTILAPFFDALRFYRKRKGRSLIYFMKTYVGSERIARVVGEGARAQLEVLRLPGADRFDVSVEESPHSPNLKTANFAMLSEILQTNPELMNLIGDIVLEESPLPGPLVQKIKERIAQARKPDPAQERAKMAEIAKTEMEAERAKMDALLKQARAQMELARPVLEQDKLDSASFKEALEAMQTLLQIGAQINQTARGKENGGQ